MPLNWLRKPKNRLKPIKMPDQYHLRLSPHLRKQIKETAQAMYECGLADSPDSAKWIRRAAVALLKEDRKTLDIMQGKAGGRAA